MSDRPEIQQGIIANDQATITVSINTFEQTMGNRVEQTHSGSGDNVAGDKVVGDKHVHNYVYPSAPLLKRTGDGPPNNLPGARKLFFGRAEVLEELHQRLQTGNHQVAIASVDGMGGVGKTELALQYAHWQLHETYRGGAVWLAGEQAGVELLDFARPFFPNENLSDRGDLPKQLRYCFDHWPAKEMPPESVLLIFDDVTDYRAQVHAILPPDSRFRVLITTRAKFQGVERLELQVLTPEAALQLLESIVGTERIAAERATAEALCEWLGFLPLGVELIGYYQQRTYHRLATVQERLVAQKLDARAITPKDHQFPVGMTARRGVKAAFELSWQTLSAEVQELAIRLGLFAAAPIPWKLVRSCYLSVDEEDLEDWRDQLVQLHMLNRIGEAQYQLHSLIREFFLLKGSEHPAHSQFQKEFLYEIVKIAKTVPQTVTQQDIERIQIAYPHIELAAELHDKIDDQDFMWPIEALERLAKGNSFWDLAENYANKQVSIIKSRFGLNHYYLATAINNLALLHRAKGRLKDAEAELKEALRIDYLTLPPNHPSFATRLNNLAGIYQLQKRYWEAGYLYVQALAIDRISLHPGHPGLAIDLNNHAGLYLETGQYDEALNYGKEAVEILRIASPLHLQDLTTCLNTLSGIYYFKGFLEEAELLSEEALSVSLKIFPTGSPLLARYFSNSAFFCQLREHYKDAEYKYIRGLEICLEKLEAGHQDTQVLRKNFRTFVQTVIKADRAADLSNHPLTQAILQQLTTPPNP